MIGHDLQNEMSKAMMVMLISIVITLLLAGSVWAKLGIVGIGGRYGYVIPEEPIEGAFGLGAVISLGNRGSELRLEGNLDYWSSTYNQPVPAFTGFYSKEWTWRDVALGATAKYMIPTRGALDPFLGFGYAVHFFKWEWTEQQVSDSANDSATKKNAGFHAVGGIDVELSPNLRGGVEARYAIADPDHFGIFGTITYVLGQ